MTLARTQPTLRTRILEHERGLVTIPTGSSGITKPVKESYTERYRGTEFDTHVEPPTISEPLVSRGRMLMLVTSCATAVVIGTVLGSLPA